VSFESFPGGRPAPIVTQFRALKSRKG
jgi:hypothetical protein